MPGNNRIIERQTAYRLGLATGILVGITVALLAGTLAFHMHLEQMDQVRHEHQQMMRDKQ